MRKSILIDKYKRRNDKLFHLFDHVTLKGTRLIFMSLLILQAAMMLFYAFNPESYLSMAGSIVSLFLTLLYYFRVNEKNRRSAIYKLFAWILILSSAFDLGSNFVEMSWVWEDISLNTLFLVSGIAMYGEFLKIRQATDRLLWL